MAKTLSYINTTPKKGSTSQQQTSTAVSRPAYVGGGASSSRPTDVQLKKNYMAGILTGKGYALIDPDFIAADFYTWEFDGLYLRRRLLLLNGFTGPEPSALDDLSNPISSWLHGSILGHGSRGSFLGPLFAAGVFRDMNTGLDIYSELKSAYSVILASMKRLEKDHRNYLHNPAFTDGMEGWTASSSVSILSLNDVPLFLGALYTFPSGVSAVREYQGRNMLYLSGGSVSQPSALIRQQEEYILYDEGEEPVSLSLDTEDEGEPGDEGEGTLDSGGGTGGGVIEDVTIGIEDIAPVESYTSVKGRMYLEVRFICLSDGTMSVGMDGNGYQPSGGDDAALPYESVALTAGTDWRVYRSEGYWDGAGTFRLSFTGEMYVDYILLTDAPFDEAAEQRLSAYRQSLNNIKTAFVTINSLKAKLAEVNGYVQSFYAAYLAEVERLQTQIDSVNETLDLHEDAINNQASSIDSHDERISAVKFTADSALQLAKANLRDIEDELRPDVTDLKKRVIALEEIVKNITTSTE